LDIQLGFQTTIPLDLLSIESTILTPLTNGEQKEERETMIYTKPFVHNLDGKVSPQMKKTPTKREKKEKIIKSKQPINVNVVSNDVNMLWQEKFQSDASLDFSNPQIV
jgi:hypothetical protein